MNGDVRKPVKTIKAETIKNGKNKEHQGQETDNKFYAHVERERKTCPREKQIQGKNVWKRFEAERNHKQSARTVNSLGLRFFHRVLNRHCESVYATHVDICSIRK